MKTLSISYVMISIIFSFTVVTFLGSSKTVYAVDNLEIKNQEYDVEIQEIALLYITSKNEFRYYLNDRLYSLLAHIEDNPNMILDSLQKVPTNRPVIIFIANNEVLDSLAPADKQQLEKLYDDHHSIGVGSEGGKLKSLLDITVGSDFDTAAQNSETDTIFFLQKGIDGIFDELLLQNITDPQGALQRVLEWDREIDTDVKNRAAPSGGAWNASYTMDYRTSLDGGTTRFLVNGFKLKSPADKPDYYLVTMSIQSAITDHNCDAIEGNCGFFTNEMYISAQVDNGGKLYDYMPTGSVGTSTSGFTIGGSLDTNGPSLSAAYSESYSISDATYIDNSNFVTNNAKWTIKFTEPNYFWFPTITDAPNVSRNSYKTDPALIIEVPKGECARVSLYPYTLQENDSFLYYVIGLQVTQHFSAWHSKDTPLPQTVICENQQ